MPSMAHRRLSLGAPPSRDKRPTADGYFQIPFQYGELAGGFSLAGFTVPGNALVRIG